jgi:benzodiazapine receptor
MKNILRVIFSFAIVFGALGLAAYCLTPQAASWYAAISKPAFTPPSWILGPVWIVLYFLMAIALIRVLGFPFDAASRRWSFVFVIQLLLNILWAVLFFTFHSLLLSVVDIVVLWFAVVILTVNASEIDRTAFWLLVPYFAWITFVLILDIGIWWID